jgi:hypothetical protein
MMNVLVNFNHITKESIIMEFNDKAKQFAKELTMEQIRQQNLQHREGNVNTIVSTVADTMESYYNAILANSKLQNLL